ncbi:hypothetical protein [Vibrio gallicus]|uniref:hypothetical protein n=1 Tax=Vibrio gallicus TaxID=190897 RepID=UPI0021C306C7|nr:hypothetical protein [Vibrio gallicus]
MKYSDWLEKYYAENPSTYKDTDLEIKRVRFVESVIGDEHKYSYYRELVDGLELFNWDSNDWEKAMSDEDEKVAVEGHINEWFSNIKQRTKRAEELIESTFSSYFIEEMEDADEVIKEELVEYFESILKKQEQAEAVFSSQKIIDAF